jgi:beta-galactosidase/beta-glucuronidase
MCRRGPRFRYSPTAHGDDRFAAADFDDSGWQTLTVPSHWQLAGFGAPAYTNVRYPFPVDPPRVPDGNPTGDYRVSFDLPGGWAGGSVTPRFDGLDSCGRVWLNGRLIGDQGEPLIDVSLRRWTTEALAAAAHPTDLVPGDQVWINLDHRQNGLGDRRPGPVTAGPHR